jgi:hypothetical protein
MPFIPAAASCGVLRFKINSKMPERLPFFRLWVPSYFELDTENSEEPGQFFSPSSGQARMDAKLSATFLLYLWIHHTNLNKIVGAKVSKILILTRCGSWMALQLSHPTK